MSSLFPALHTAGTLFAVAKKPPNRNCPVCAGIFRKSLDKAGQLCYNSAVVGHGCFVLGLSLKNKKISKTS